MYKSLQQAQRPPLGAGVLRRPIMAFSDKLLSLESPPFEIFASGKELYIKYKIKGMDNQVPQCARKVVL